MQRQDISENLLASYHELFTALRNKHTFGGKKLRELFVQYQHALTTEKSGYDVSLLINPYSRLISCCNSDTDFETIIVSDKDFQEHVIDPVWNFHYHQVLHPKVMTEVESERKTFPLGKLPPDIANMIALDVGLKPTFHSCLTDSATYTLFKPELHKIKLMDHILKNDMKQATKMLEASSNLAELLFDCTKGVAYSHLPFTGSSFQAAICSKNIKLLEMIEILCKGKKFGRMMGAQIKALCPADKFVNGPPYDLGPIVAEITQSDAADIQAALDKKQNDTSLCHALNLFREKFAALCMAEKIFNPNHLVEALRIYFNEFNNFGTDEKRALFSRQVFGYMQRFVPAWLAKAFSQGISGIVNKHEPLQDTFDFKSSGRRYFPLDLDPDFRLGFDCYSTWQGGALIVVAGGANWVSGDAALTVQNFFIANTTEFAELMQRLQNPNPEQESDLRMISCY